MSSYAIHRKGHRIGVQVQKNRSKKYAKSKKSHHKRLERWKEGLTFIPGTHKRSSSHISSHKRVQGPEVFSLVKNTEEALDFFNKLRDNLNHRRRTYIDLSLVKEITNDAIITMLTLTAAFKERNLSISGNVPSDPIMRDYLEKSGFFDYVGGYNVAKPIENKNQILTESNVKVMSLTTSELVSDAVETIFGAPGRSTGIQRALIELMGNTFDHASITNKKEKWWLSVFHDLDEKKVTFAFVDIGVGILETIKLRRIKKILTDMNITQPNRILEEVMTGEIGSRHGLKSRGQGLPSLLTSQDRSSFGNLVVITNSAMGRISDNNYLNLNKSFDGTMFYWEFDQSHLWIKSK